VDWVTAMVAIGDTFQGRASHAIRNPTLQKDVQCEGEGASVSGLSVKNIIVPGIELVQTVRYQLH
jgi:hypothetical protein